MKKLWGHRLFWYVLAVVDAIAGVVGVSGETWFATLGAFLLMALCLVAYWQMCYDNTQPSDRIGLGPLIRREFMALVRVLKDTWDRMNNWHEAIGMATTVILVIVLALMPKEIVIVLFTAGSTGWIAVCVWMLYEHQNSLNGSTH